MAQQHLTQCSQAEALADRVASQRQEQAEQDQCRQTLEEQREHLELSDNQETQAPQGLHRKSEGQAEQELAELRQLALPQRVAPADAQMQSTSRAERLEQSLEQEEMD